MPAHQMSLEMETLAIEERRRSRNYAAAAGAAAAAAAADAAGVDSVKMEKWRKKLRNHVPIMPEDALMDLLGPTMYRRETISRTEVHDAMWPKRGDDIKLYLAAMAASASSGPPPS
ncbi:unnamed protein product [Linum trigynum]